ncbi:MAG: ATP-binding cassette domain-containing protein, partial [Anaerolineales bacterium]
MNTIEAHFETRHLNAYYGNVQALKDVSIIIPRRQITMIIGPSGCGKTSLLKCL